MATKTVSEITVNNIRIGGKAPKKIMKGSTEVKEVKKGSTVVYKKEDITYTLSIMSTGQAGAQSTEIRHYIYSYKGSSTPVALSTSNIQVTAGGGTVKSVNVHASYPTCYVVIIGISANSSSHNTVTHTIKVTQPVSGQSITVSGTQAKLDYYININKIGFRFSGAFPTPIFDWTLHSVYFNNNYSGETNVYHENKWGDATNPGYVHNAIAAIGIKDGTIHWNERSINGPQFTNETVVGFKFSFGNTWSGTTAYSGNTWYLHTKDTYSNYNFIVPASTSMQWQTYVQPSGPIGIQTKMQNINSITSGKNIDLVFDVNWSWSNYWNNNT